MVRSLFLTHCFIDYSVKGHCQYCPVSVTLFDKDYEQMNGMTCKGKHHKIDQTEIKYV